MGKRKEEISVFNQGIMLNADEKDIANSTASFSLNVDPLSQNGILSAINVDKFIGAIDNNASRASMPTLYGAGTNANHTDIFPKFTEESISVSNIQDFEKGNKFSFVGTKGHIEKLSFDYAMPHLERLIISQNQLGVAADAANTYGAFQPSANIGLNDSEIAIPTDNATSINLIDSFSEGDYIQFNSGTSVIAGNLSEIIKITSVDTDNNKLIVERGVFGSLKLEYASATTYNIFANRISYYLKGLQSGTSLGHLVDITGWSKIVGNNIKGSSLKYFQRSTTGLKQFSRHVTASGSLTTDISFDATAKTMTIKGNSALDSSLQKGTTFTFYAEAHGDSANHGKTFKVLSQKSVAALSSQDITFLLDTAPTTETITGVTKNFYFEPGLIKNFMFFIKSASSGVGDDQIQKVNDWYQYRHKTAYTSWNAWEQDDEANVIIQDNSNGLFADTNVFGSDISSNRHPYTTENYCLKLGSNYVSQAVHVEIDNDPFTVSDNIIKLPSGGQTLSKHVFAKDDIIYVNNEYMKVDKIDYDGIHVTRGLFNTTIAQHADGDDIFKHAGYEITQTIDKDLLKPDTEYELNFWGKILTSTAATTTLTCVSGTLSHYDEKTFNLMSASGTNKTYIFDNTNGGLATGTITDNDNIVVQIYNASPTVTTIAAQVEAAIEHANGHGDEITVSQSSGVLTLTQLYTGESGNTEVSHDIIAATMTCANFTGGTSPNPAFSLEVNGGYIDAEGAWNNYELNENDGFEGSLVTPARNARYNEFSLCSDFWGIDSMESNMIDNIRWRQLSFIFKTPKELIETDLSLTFTNRGVSGTFYTIANVDINEETTLYNSSIHSATATSSGIINNNNSKDLILYDSKNSILRVMQNFNKDSFSSFTDSIDASPLGSMTANSSTNEATFTAKNREVHIGFGSGKSDSSPKWLGYLNHKIFGKKSEDLYIDTDAIASYDNAGVNSLDKICVAGEWEDVEGVVSGNQMTVDGITHGLTAGDNIVVRKYKDANNSWAGNGVWWVSSVTDADTFVCKRNLDLDNGPGNDTYRISFRPHYYYGIRRGGNYLYRITPEDRVIAVSGANDTVYTKGKIERSDRLDFPVESICCSYSKKTDGTDGGHIYALSTYGDKIYRLNMNVAYNTWETTRPSATETISMVYKSFKWSNLTTVGDPSTSAGDYVYDSKAVESTATINISGMPSDIIETKGPLVSFNWSQTDNTNADVNPDKFDTRLWIQSYPPGEDDTFTDGDRFLFCGRTEYNQGSHIVYFGDRTPPTVARYGLKTRYADSGVKFTGGPFIRATESRAGDNGNDELPPGYVGSRALWAAAWTDTSSKNKIGYWRRHGSYDFAGNKPVETTGSERYAATSYSKPYVSWGCNVGWDGNGSKKTSIRVARYGLFQIADNDGDGLLDGTGVIVPNTDNVEVKRGELGRKMSSHAVGLIGSSDLPWIRFGGKLLGNGGNSTEYYVSHFPYDSGLLTHVGGRRDTLPEYIDANKIVFVCTDMHFGDYPQHSRYDVTVAADTVDLSGLGNAYETKCTTTEDNYLQPGDLILFKGTGDWTGWNKSHAVIHVTDTKNFYVAELTASPGTAIGSNNSGEFHIGGYRQNASGTGTKYGARARTRTEDNSQIEYHFSLNDEDKLNGSIFNEHGGFGRYWYVDQDNFGPINTADFAHPTSILFPAFQSRVEQLNWCAGFMIRPFNMDDTGFESLLIGNGTSVDMPSYPDAIYHSTNVLKTATGDTGNHLASRLFISSPGAIDANGEIQKSKLFLCEWNFLYPDLASFIPAESITHDLDSDSFEHQNSHGQREVYFAGTLASTAIVANANTEIFGDRPHVNATNHPSLEIDMDALTYNAHIVGQTASTHSGMGGFTRGAHSGNGWESGSTLILTPASTTGSGSLSSTKVQFNTLTGGSYNTAISSATIITKGSGHAINDELTFTHASSGGGTSSVVLTVTSLSFSNFYRVRDVLAGLYVTVVDQTTGFTQTRKIVGSRVAGINFSDNMWLNTNYPFSHTPVSGDKFYVWSGRHLATAPVRLVKEETLRHDGTAVYSKDPILSGPMYPRIQDVGAINGDGTTATAQTADFHNLTTNDSVSIDRSTAFNGTYTITVTGPKHFTFSHTSNATGNSGTWELVSNSESSAANPLSIPLDSPAIKMSYGDLDMRKLVTDVTETAADKHLEAGTGSGSQDTVESTGHDWVAGNSITIKRTDSTASNHAGTYPIVSTDTNTFVITNPDSTDDDNEFTITTNQWGGIGASTTGKTSIGEIRAGLAQWDKGNIAGNVPRYDAEDDTRFINTTETSVVITPGSLTSTTGFFKKNTQYNYKVSLIYDGYQEGPLSTNFWTYRETDTRTAIDIQINIKSFSKRLTAVCIYRKDGTDNLYRLVQQIPTDSGWADDGEQHYYNMQDTGPVRATYESRTGISELTVDLAVKYGLSCELDGYLFVGNCSHNKIEDASHQIFRSKAGKWSSFDWATDFCIINSRPTALIAFLGRLIVFDNNTMYKINPQNMTIEDIFEGVGCASQNSITVTEYGMFFANRQGAYMYNGDIPNKISSIIQKGGKNNMLTLTDSSSVGTSEIIDLSWDNTAGSIENNPPYVTFDAKNNLAYFVVQHKNSEKDIYYNSASSSTSANNRLVTRTYIWSFSFQLKRWDLWELAKDEEVGKPFIGKDGGIYTTIGNGIYQIGGGADKKLYTWLSKKFTLGTSTTKKVFNKIRTSGPKESLLIDGDVGGTDSDKLIVATEKGRITSGSNSTTANIAYKSDDTEGGEYKLKGVNKSAKWLQFKLEEMEEDVSAISIIYRLKAVK